MSMYIPEIPVCVAIGCSGVASVFQLMAVAGSGWVKLNIPGSSGTGLFCTEDFCTWKGEGWMTVCQSLSIFALGTIVSNFLLGVMHLFKEDTQKLTFPARAFSATGAVCVAMEVGLYAGNTIVDFISSSPFSYGYGFYLSIVAGMLSVLSAILHRHSARHDYLFLGDIGEDGMRHL